MSLSDGGKSAKESACMIASGSVGLDLSVAFGAGHSRQEKIRKLLNLL